MNLRNMIITEEGLIKKLTSSFKIIDESGQGKICYEWSGDGILKFNLVTAIVATIQQDDVGRNRWDINIDGTKYKYLQAEDKTGGGYDTEIYTLPI